MIQWYCIAIHLGYLTGYDGKFSFKLGEKYDFPNNTTVHFYGMRAFSASLGAITILLMHATVLTLSKSEEAALITSILLVRILQLHLISSIISLYFGILDIRYRLHNVVSIHTSGSNIDFLHGRLCLFHRQVWISKWEVQYMISSQVRRMKWILYT